MQSSLNTIGIPSVVYYPISLSKQLGYKSYPSVSSGVAVSEMLSSNVLSLPMHPYLSIESQIIVTDHIKNNL